MAAPSCIPSLMPSPFKERFTQESFADHGQSNAVDLEQKLLAFLQKMHNSPGEDLKSNPSSDNKPQDSQANSVVSSATTHIAPDSISSTVGISQAQQLLMLLSTLPFQTVVPKATESANDNRRTGLTQRPNPPTVSPNILQQLLSGVDISQVRTRSGLIESALPPRSSYTTSMASETNSQSPHSRASSSQPTSGDSASSPGANYNLPQSTGKSFSSTQPTTQSIIPLLQLPSAILYPPMNQVLTGSNPLIQNMTFPEQLLALLVQLERTLQLGKTNALITESTPHTGAHIGNGNTNQSPDPVIITSYPFRLHHLLTTTGPSPPHSKNSPCTSMVSDGSVQVVDPPHPLNATRTPGIDKRNSTHDRPRCHSDGHTRMGYRHKLLRPRSNSKAEQSMKPISVKDDPEVITKELESSLFAQLVLSTDSSITAKTTTTKLELPMKREANQPTISHTNLPGHANHMELYNAPNSPPHRSPGLLCCSKLRGRIFEWLREADLFVAEHCWDIPLGALLATAISPGQSALTDVCPSIAAAVTSDPASIPSTAKHVVAKSWHQFLLIALMEHNCILQPTQNGSTAKNPADSMLELLKLTTMTTAPSSNRNNDSSVSDWFLCNELTSLVTAAAELKLDADIYKSIRFCILAQSAYPRHFATSYSEAISKLELRFCRAPMKPSSFTEVLKLLNRLHCFDAGTLKQFFCLVSDHLVASIDVNPGQTSSNSHTRNQESCTYGAKRKACGQLPSTRPGSIDRDPSPVHMRSRAYTTNSYNKSARLVTSSGRDRSNTAPSDSRR